MQLFENAPQSSRLPVDSYRSINAGAESLFATLECELIDREPFRTRTEDRMAVFDFIEGFYNPKRRHSACGQLSRAEYERRWAKDQTAVA